MAKKQKGEPQQNKKFNTFNEAKNQLFSHAMFSPLAKEVRFYWKEQGAFSKDGWAVVTQSGEIHANATQQLSVEEWCYVLAHGLLHLAFGHFQQKENQWYWNIACDVYIAKFLADLKWGKAPGELAYSFIPAIKDEESFYEQLLISGLPKEICHVGTAGDKKADLVFNGERTSSFFRGAPKWEALFAKGLANAVYEAVEIASENQTQEHKNTVGYRAREWFINHYPLLGALAANFTIIEDVTLCHRLQIRVAAIDVEAKEIYLNPTAKLDEEETKFVMAHELLHAGLMHHERRQGRDHYYWNVACDYVINQWLVEMDIGAMPRIGVLFDPELKGKSAEEIYDYIVTNIRKFRKLNTMRGIEGSDILNKNEPFEAAKEWTTIDDFIRSAMNQGLIYHTEQNRGFLPAGLIEEIKALEQPPIPWDVQLARWFDYHFRPLEKRRTYTRLSRRQSATPTIPRPAYITPEEQVENRTFGVLIDTSGSMSHHLLAKALGAIASYSVARDVPYVRVVFCDAQTYDEGFMTPEEIAGKVKVKGRGGTVLQPGIDLLQNAKDFPKDGPILIITDGGCERLTIKRNHAFILPKGNALPFIPKGPVFRIQ